MPSYSSWNGVKVSGDKHLLTEILKGELGFEGFLISDYNAIDQIDRGLQEGRSESSINAGMDMAMVPDHYKQYIDDLKQLVERGRGADVAHRRRGDADSAREVRHGPDGSEALATGRPQPAEELRLARTSRRWRARRCASRWCC